MQEVKQQNPVLHRKIKGGKSDPPAEGQDSVLDEQPMADRNPPEREENQRTQVELPPESNARDTGVNGVGEEKETQRDVKSDEEMRSEGKSLENDGRPREIEKPLAVDSNENLATTVENDGAFIRTDEQGVGLEKIDSNRPMAREGVVAANKPMAHEVVAGVVQKREAEEVGLEEGNQLPGPAGKAGVVVKTKAKPSMSPSTSDSGPADAVSDSIGVKPKVKGSQTRVVTERNLPTEGTSAPPSLPPGAFARRKPKVVVGKDGAVTKEMGAKVDGGAPGGGVRSVQKESVPGGGAKGEGGGERDGEGGGEEEKHISAVEMAKAIESGEMVSLQSRI